MGQRLLTLRVRPPRLVVLINEKATSADFIGVIRFLSQTWGGRFSPIVPVTAGYPDELTAFRLQNTRPDFVFGLGLTDNVWEPAIRESCQPRQYVPLSLEIANDVRKADRLELIHADRAIISRCEAKAKSSAIARTLRAVSIDHNSEWSPFVAAVFGIHHKNLGEQWRDEQVSIEDTTAVDFINTNIDFVENWKESWLDAGSYGLNSHHQLSLPADPTIVLVRHVVKDLSLFWNLRSGTETKRPAWLLPLPAEACNDCEVRDAVRRWLLAFHKYGEHPNYCVMTSSSVPQAIAEEAMLAMRETMKDTAIKYFDYESPKNRLPQVVPFEHTCTWPADLNERQLTVVPPSPRTFRVSRSEAWFVDIVKDNATGRALKEMVLPESTVIPELLNGPCPPSFEHSIMRRVADGVDSINIRCTSSKESIHLYIPSATEVLEEIVREHGYEIVADEKRSSYLPTIKRFGGVQLAATAFAGQSGQVLEILRSGRSKPLTDPQADKEHQVLLSKQGHSLSASEIRSIGKFGKGRLSDNHYLDRIEVMLKSESERIRRIGMKRYQRYAGRDLPTQMTLEALLEHWADRSVARRQWRVGPCHTCHRDSFIEYIDLKKSVHCEYCGHRVRIRGALQIAYTLERSTRHAINEGMVPVVLAGRFLKKHVKSRILLASWTKIPQRRNTGRHRLLGVLRRPFGVRRV